MSYHDTTGTIHDAGPVMAASDTTADPGVIVVPSEGGGGGGGTIVPQGLGPFVSSP